MVEDAVHDSQIGAGAEEEPVDAENVASVIPHITFE